MIKKISVYEYAQLIGVTPKTVYKMIGKNEVITTRETINKRVVTRVIIDDEEKLSKNDTHPQVHEVNIQEEQEEMYEPQKTYYDYNLEVILKDYVDIRKQLISYAELAGQVKLLEDSEHRTKESYFEVVQENKTLIQQQAELKAKLELKEEKLKQLEEQLNNTHSGLASWLKKL